MEAKLYRSIVRDVTNNRDIAVMRLVMQEQVLFNGGINYYTIVNLSACSMEDYSEVEYVTFENGVPAGAAVMKAVTSELLDAHAKGEDALRSYLYKVLTTLIGE